ncbi:ribosomal protein S18-alanine N-acetyltransferase [Haploplasma modicum]|uniref:ribosomal protein S18-alanine N-acetyltransferase n=1 Tax=Haploplasma modicum TaxID=2150 RepID=UPI00047E513F|nr:ribosomal protein S18-alanine N-acetyltransferase [Haploplasma modicum]MCR1809328.1 ribosomal protein S18-alanine N-acetyltransferase [Haploplasma modicum]
MIRKMELNDIVSVVNLEKKILKDTLGEKFLYSEIMYNPFARFFVYEQNKQIIGYIGCRYYDDTGELLNFVVDDFYQQRGFGTLLFNEVINLFKNEDVKTITLEVRRSNIKAQKFYAKNDFYLINVRKNYYETEDALVLMKEL